MSDYLNRINRPIITGTPELNSGRVNKNQNKASINQSFASIFNNAVKTREEKGQVLTFSKHALDRTAQRGIDISDENLQRLGEAVETAKDKGLEDALVLMDNNAFIVNVPNRVVVTVVGKDDENKVFTNINGAVII